MNSQTDRCQSADWPKRPAAFSLQLGDDGEVRRYFNTPRQVHQPALDRNIVCIHLGGAKRVRRLYEGGDSVHDIALGAVTLLPRGMTNRWETEGPVDYAHLSLRPGFLETLSEAEFDRDGSNLRLFDAVGIENRLLTSLILETLNAGNDKPGQGRLHGESLITSLALILLRDHCSISRQIGIRASNDCKGGMPGWRLSRVLEHMRSEIRGDPGIDDLAATAGLSRAQFFRAFRQETRTTPARYLEQIRVDCAKRLLADRTLDCETVARRSGLRNRHRMRDAFVRCTRLSPSRYRALIS